MDKGFKFSLNGSRHVRYMGEEDHYYICRNWQRIEVTKEEYRIHLRNFWISVAIAMTVFSFSMIGLFEVIEQFLL